MRVEDANTVLRVSVHLHPSGEYLLFCFFLMSVSTGQAALSAVCPAEGTLPWPTLEKC